MQLGVRGRCKLYQRRGAVVSSPYGVWGGAPAEIEFCTFTTFYPKNLTSSGTILIIFLINQLAKFGTV